MPRKKKTEKVEKVIKPSFYQAVGRRKEATARVRFYLGEVEILGRKIDKGEIIVNNRPAEEYFPGETLKKLYLEPFRITNTLNRFSVSIKVEGGGRIGQLEAIIHGVSRVLNEVNKEEFRPLLKKRGFLTRDSRAKERRKAGYAQKARAKKQSPKR